MRKRHVIVSHRKKFGAVELEVGSESKDEYCQV